jgi:hypothetical protein
MSTPAEKLNNELWQAINEVATSAGFNTDKFGEAHKDVVKTIAEFLATPPSSTEETSTGWANVPLLSRFLTKPQSHAPAIEPVHPIIICGEPGTGKTTFLYMIDFVLRTKFNLPDNVESQMEKNKDRKLPVHKRMFNDRPISLLSVRKWKEILHFYAWDVDQHRLNQVNLTNFIQSTLLPMKIIFADEVEMVGYSPTIPNLAKNGILIVGSSNQTKFIQLAEELVPPKIYEFSGIDMREGDPGDAVVTKEDRAWELFTQLESLRYHTFEILSYQYMKKDDTVYVLFNFKEAVQAPLLETEWINFLQATYKKATNTKLEPGLSYVLLFDGFSLDLLSQDYSAIIRFVSLFDAVEQLGIGVFVRNKEKTPELSRETIKQMKLTIQNSKGVSEEVKLKTVVGVDRCTSRLGQAGHKSTKLR